MTRYDRQVQALAVCLSALAGYVDALGFMHLHGFFVSFMSGNSTRLAVGLIDRSADAIRAGQLIALFVVGVVIGAIVGRLAARRQRQTVLALVAALLATGALAAHLDRPAIAVIAMVLAMGAENAVFQRDGQVHIGLTYMTGTLVKLGQQIAVALSGGKLTGWLPYLLLWSGLVGGAILGASIHTRIGLAGLWLAALVAAACAVWSAVISDSSLTDKRT